MTQSILDALAGDVCWCNNGVVPGHTARGGFRGRSEYRRWWYSHKRWWYSHNSHCAVCHVDLNDDRMMAPHEVYCQPEPAGIIMAKCMRRCGELISNTLESAQAGTFYQGHSCR